MKVIIFISKSKDHRVVILQAVKASFVSHVMSSKQQVAPPRQRAYRKWIK